MNSTDQKIFELIDLLINTGRIEYVKDFGEEIGVLKQNILRIKQGKAHFTAEHIKAICKIYNVNANWIFNDDAKVFYKAVKNKKAVYK